MAKNRKPMDKFMWLELARAKDTTRPILQHIVQLGSSLYSCDGYRLHVERNQESLVTGAKYFDKQGNEELNVVGVYPDVEYVINQHIKRVIFVGLLDVKALEQAYKIAKGFNNNTFIDLNKLANGQLEVSAIHPDTKDNVSTLLTIDAFTRVSRFNIDEWLFPDGFGYRAKYILDALKGFKHCDDIELSIDSQGAMILGDTMARFALIMPVMK